jgi:hypothetical protein
MRLSFMRLYVSVIPVGVASAVALIGAASTGWKW